MNDKNIEEIVIYHAYIDADPSKFLVNKPLIIKADNGNNITR